MSRKLIRSLAIAMLTLVATSTVRAQPYSNAVMALSPVAYWPLNETTQPPQPINLTAFNLGNLGAAGNGFYGAWYQTNGNTWFMTNNIVQRAGATVDGDVAMNCQFKPGQYIVLPRNANGVPNTALTMSPPFSIECWVNSANTNSSLGGIVSEGEVPLLPGGPNTNNPFYGGSGAGGTANTVWAGFALGQFANFYFFDCFETNAWNNKGNELDGPKTIVPNQWIHLVATYDGVTEIMYENGAQVASKRITANAKGQTFVADPTSPLMIGSGSDVSANYGVAFTGGLDEVAIYKSVLPLSSIQAHYQTAFGTNATFGSNYTNAVLADNPMIYFRMDDPQGVTNAGYPSGTFPVANNYGSLGTAANGVYQPGTTPGVAGPNYSGFGSNTTAVAINGWFGAVDIGNSNIPAALNPTGKSPLTLATWFKTGPADSPGRFQEIIGHSDLSYRLALGSVAGENHFNPGPGPELQFTTASQVATNGFAFNDGQWHMVAGVTDGTNEFLYMDGALAVTSSNAAGINITGSTRDLLLGGDPQYTIASDNTSNTIRNFDGEIAQVAFWSNALSGAQIQSLFNAAAVPPYYWQEPVSSISTNANLNVTITTGIRGSAPITYQWFQNGLPAAGQTGPNLVFTPITTNNAGSFFLVASNTGGSTTSTVVNITVFGPPTIQQQTPADLRIFAGSSPTLHVSVTGATPLTYQWTSNSAIIAGATASSFTVSNVQATATYGCTASNSIGTATTVPIVMTVLSDPTAPFPSAVLGDGAIAYFRLDEANGTTTSYDYTGGNNGIYTNVTLGVPGYDSLNAVQSDPTETGGEFGDVPPNNDFAGYVPTYLNFGQPTGNAEFSIEAWVTQFLFLNGGDCIVGLGFGNGGEQFVLDTGNGSQGAIRFFVRNAAGTTASATGTNVIVNDGKWHHLVGVCDEAGGHVLLYMDGVQVGIGNITAGSGILASSFPMSIGARQSANNNPTNYDFQFIGQIDDVAVYNKALTASQIQSHFLASGLAPTVQVTPNNVTTNQGASVTFTATSTGTAPINYSWTDPNNTVVSTSNTLTLTVLQPSQSGNYTVTATNPYGSANASASLNVVLGPPTITQDTTPTNVTTFTGNTVDLTVVVSGSLPISYQWFRDGSSVASATNSSYAFPALLGTNTYFCVITNAFSQSLGSGPINSATATVIGVPVTTLNPSNYSSSVKITFAGYTRTETLQDFPVLVRLGTNISGFSYQQFASPTGGDLRFTDASGTRELPYEIDEWNDTNGVSSVWVQVPQLTGTTNGSTNFIFAYWGNPNATTPATNGNVWVPQTFEGLPAYDIVYHLKEANFPYADSALAYPSLSGVAPVAGPGIVGTAELFNGSSDFLDAGLVTNLSGVFTLSAWVNIPTNASNIQTIWANQKGGFGSAGFAFFVDFFQTADQEMLVDTGDGVTGHEPTTAAGVVPFGSWHMLSASLNSSNNTVSFYMDGTPEGTGAMTPNFTTVADLNLGRFTNANFYFTGSIDEARIHAGIDSTNWIWASWMTVASNSAFESFSSFSTLNVTITATVSGGNLVLTWPQGILQSSPNVNGPYSDVVGATSPHSVPLTGARQFYRVRNSH